MNPNRVDRAVSPRVAWRAGSSVAARRFQLPASMASNAHTFAARGLSFDESAPWQQTLFRSIVSQFPRRTCTRGAGDTFSLFSHSSFPGWSRLADVTHRAQSRTKFRRLAIRDDEEDPDDDSPADRRCYFRPEH